MVKNNEKKEKIRPITNRGEFGKESIEPGVYIINNF